MRNLLAAGLLGFVLGAFVVGSLGDGHFLRRVTGTPAAEPIDASPSAVVEAPAGTSGKKTPAPATVNNAAGPSIGPNESADLAARRLTIPVQGVAAAKLVDTYHDARTGHEHEALDILAPRDTPVVAVEDGTVARLFLSKAGGLTIYQFDPAKEYCYYYAHLDHYAAGLKEGQAVHRGEVMGYVGTTGNAPKDTPHLHFAIFKLTPDKHWWEGSSIDPYPILR